MAQPAIAKPSDWQTYRRLLGYVGRYWFIMTVSVVAFLFAAGAEAYFVKLFGELIDQWDDLKVRAAASIPAMMGGGDAGARRRYHRWRNSDGADIFWRGVQPARRVVCSGFEIT